MEIPPELEDPVCAYAHNIGKKCAECKLYAGDCTVNMCTECHTFAQIDYVLTGPFANERRPDDVQLTCEGIERWNEHCDDWEGIFNHE